MEFSFYNCLSLKTRKFPAGRFDFFNWSEEKLKPMLKTLSLQVKLKNNPIQTENN